MPEAIHRSESTVKCGSSRSMPGAWFKEKETLRVSGHHGKGLGMGEVHSSYGGDGDGCDRCGCPDEEACCQGFWNDNGVPPFWPLNRIFNPKNRCLNNNRQARMFGNLGFPFFDKVRATFITLLGIVWWPTSLSLPSTLHLVSMPRRKGKHSWARRSLSR